jgi:hypothetical protein
MPNWCQNRLTVTGSEQELLRFAKETIGANTRQAALVMTADAHEERVDPREIIQSTKTLHEAYPVLKLSEQPLSMESSFPTPKELLDNGGWYDYRISKSWGTKWDLSFSGPGIAIVVRDNEVPDSGDIQMFPAEDGQVSLFYRFDSAWSPPFIYIPRVAKLYPSLHFALQWAECGHGEAGRIVCHEEAGISIAEELPIEQVLSQEDSHYF